MLDVRQSGSAPDLVGLAYAVTDLKKGRRSAEIVKTALAASP
jgi:hypothetical protein